MATTPYPFVSGAVLTASQLNSTFNVPVETKTDSYTLVAADGGKRIVMNKATATTITVNTGLFSAGDSVWIHNIGAGTCTITAGTATVNTEASLALGQWGGGQLYFTSGSTAIFFRGGSKQTLSVDFLLVGGGGGGGRLDVGAGAGGGGGGGAGGFVTGSGIVGKGTYTVKVGAGGAATTVNGEQGKNGTASGFLNTANGGGGGSGSAGAGGSGASGGGCGANATTTGGSAISGEGSAGGSGVNNTAAGGGGGASAVGANGSGSTSGTGGNGSTNNYNGSSTTYAGGGGGGGNGGSRAGGTGGGGAGNTSGTAGTTNTGGGGGGSSNANSGAGGSGIVIIRYVTADAAGLTITATGATSGTPTADGSNSYFQYNGAGTLVVA